MQDIIECSHDRGLAVGRLTEDQSVITMATAMGASKSAITQLIKATEGGNAMQK